VDKILVDKRGRFAPSGHAAYTGGYPGGIYLDEGSGFIEVTGNLVYRVVCNPMNYNNLVQNRKATCKVHDNFFGSRPKEAEPIAAKAGLEAAYADLLQSPPAP
jgi:hypothetical protein